MAEIKYKFDYTEPENVESEVPGQQKLRENLDNSAIEKATVWDEDKIETPEDYILAPVVTITKNEATFTKGDMKLQKVSVTENISEIRNGVFHTIKAPSYPPIHSDVIHDTPLRRMETNQSENVEHPSRQIRSSEIRNMDQKSQSVFGHVSARPMRSLETQRSQPEERRTRIPTRFKNAANRVRRERSMPAKNNNETLPTPPRRSSIPRLKPKSPSPKPEDEFERLFGEIASSPTDIDISLLNNKVDDPEKVEDCFEEIIHAYDENKLQPIVVETPKQNDENKVPAVEKPKSRIPMLKRKSETEIDVPKSVQINAKVNPPAAKNRFRDVATKVYKAETNESKLLSRKAVTKRSNEKVDSDNVKLKTSYQSVKSISKDGQKHEVRVETISKVSLEKDISPENVVNIDNVTTSKIMESTVEIVSITPVVEAVSLANEVTPQPYSVEIVELPSTIEELQNKSIMIEEIKENKPKTDELKADVVTVGTKIAIDPVKIISVDEYQNMIREDLKESVEFKPVLNVNRNGTVVHNDYNPDNFAREKNSTDKKVVSTPTNVEKKISDYGAEERTVQLGKTKGLDSMKETHEDEGSVKYKSVLSKIAMFEQHRQDDKTQPSFRPKPAVRCAYRRKLTEEEASEIETNTSNPKPKIEFTTDNDLNGTKPKLPTSRIPEPQIRRTLVDSKPIIVSEIIKTVQPNPLSNKINNETYNPVTIEAVNTDVTKSENIRISQMEIRTEEVAVSNAVVERMVENQTEVSEIKESVATFDNSSSEKIKRHHPNRYYSFEVDYSREYPVNVEKAHEIEIKSLTSAEVEYSKPLHKHVLGEPKSDEFKAQETMVTELLPRSVANDPNNNFSRQNTPEPSNKNVLDVPKSNDVKLQDVTTAASVNKIIDEPQNNGFKVKNTVVTESINKNVLDGPKSNVVKVQQTATTEPVNTNSDKSNNNGIKGENAKATHEINVKPKIEDVKRDPKMSPFDFTPKTHDIRSNKHKITPMMSTEEIFNAYKAKNEDYNIRKSKSVAELDLGDAVKGKVQNLIVRMKSMDKSVEEKKEVISAKERPRKKSVSEKIAMFECIFSGATAIQANNHYQREEEKRIEKIRSEEEYKRLLEELTTAKQTYGQTTNMKKVTLNNGEEMPVMAVGTALLDSRLAPTIVATAIDLGYRAFDTAFIYGNEKAVGEGIRKKIEDGTVKREDLFIINKLWSTFHRRDLVEKAYKQSLENLGLDYVDLYLIHNPMSFKEGPNPVPMIAKVIQYSDFDYIDAWYGMEDLVAKGLVKSIGLSNFNSSQIQKILDRARVKPVVNQVECHPYLSQQRLHDFCEERKIKLSCFGVLGSKGTPQEHKNTTMAAIDDPMVKVMAAGLNISEAQLLIRYQLQSDHAVVVKASTGAHLWDNLQALNIKLGNVEMEALRALNRNKRTFVFKGMGDTHKNYPFNAPF